MNNKSKRNNVTVTALWPDDRFGEGALRSAQIDAKAFDALASVKDNCSFLVKPAFRKDGSPVTTKDGTQTYFLEILPPYEKKGNSKGRSPRAEQSEV